MYWHCEIEIGIANLNLALRNWIWHCEIGFGIAKLALRNFRIANGFGIAKLALRNFRIANGFGIAKLALRTHCEFRNAKFRKGFVREKFRKATVYWGIRFRNAKWVCELFAKIFSC